MTTACRIEGPHSCQTGEHPYLSGLVGPNPVIAAIEAGHFTKGFIEVKGATEAVGNCELCRVKWPCPPILEARVLGAKRAGGRA